MDKVILFKNKQSFKININAMKNFIKGGFDDMGGGILFGCLKWVVIFIVVGVLVGIILKYLL